LRIVGLEADIGAVDDFEIEIEEIVEETET
jgi:hypothetical protein